MQSNNITTITCKVVYQAEIRRFTLDKAEFAVLRDQLLALFPQLDKDSLVVKYTDDEKDLVTISSDEELNVALKLSNNFLRLTVSTPVDQSECKRGRWRRCDNDAVHPAWEAKFKMHCENPHFQQHRIARMTQKRDKLAARLAYLEALPPNGNEAVRLRHQEKLRRKLNFLNHFLANVPRDQPLSVPTEGGCPNRRGFHHARWADPEFRQKRITHLTRHQEKLTKRLAALDSLPPNEKDESLIRRKEKLSAKLKWISDRLEHLSNCDGQVPQPPEMHHHAHPHPHPRRFPHPHAHLHFHPHAHFYAYHARRQPGTEHAPESKEIEELTQLRTQIKEAIAELKDARRKLKEQESSESESSSSSEDSEETKRAKEEIRERIFELKKLRRSMKQACSNDQKIYKQGWKHEARAARKAEKCASRRLNGLTKEEARLAKEARRARKQERRAAMCANRSGCDFPKGM